MRCIVLLLPPLISIASVLSTFALPPDLASGLLSSLPLVLLLALSLVLSPVLPLALPSIEHHARLSLVSMTDQPLSRLFVHLT